MLRLSGNEILRTDANSIQKIQIAWESFPAVGDEIFEKRIFLMKCLYLKLVFYIALFDFSLVR